MGSRSCFHMIHNYSHWEYSTQLCSQGHYYIGEFRCTYMLIEWGEITQQYDQSLRTMCEMPSWTAVRMQWLMQQTKHIKLSIKRMIWLSCVSLFLDIIDIHSSTGWVFRGTLCVFEFCSIILISLLYVPAQHTLNASLEMLHHLFIYSANPGLTKNSFSLRLFFSLCKTAERKWKREHSKHNFLNVGLEFDSFKLWRAFGAYLKV